MNVKKLVRPNILRLKPYSSARSEFKGVADVFLDANENPYQTGFNRYPDPLQRKLKQKISEIKKVAVANIFLGNGSDEVIDLLIRMFCEPGRDEIIIQPPTYGMYKVSADIANVSSVEVPLTDHYQPDVSSILDAASDKSKLLFVCHPNNPTGNSMERHSIERLLEGFPGVVVVDEAYIDFAADSSCTELLADFKNLVVMQTFSKAWGLAGIRLGMAFADQSIIDILNKIKPPYNINQLTQDTALKALGNKLQKEQWVQSILKERESLAKQLITLPYVQSVNPSDTNFLLVRVDQPDLLYDYLIGEKIIIRNRSKVLKCDGCIRITVGTANENKQLIRSLLNFKKLT